MGYRDASFGPSSYSLSLRDCVVSVEKAKRLKWLDFESFDPKEYQRMERVEFGDLNWIIPGKLLAFCGPVSKARVTDGYHSHDPEFYLDYFAEKDIKTVVRLNKKMYDSSRFTRHGIQHHDLFFVDGSTPPDDVLHAFLEICESTPHAIAVHCKAGLGRTGSLIGCFIIKHYDFSAPESIAWLRICRPGSVIGPQQQWMLSKEAALRRTPTPDLWTHLDANLNLRVSNDDDDDDEGQESQGDLLNRRKAARAKQQVS
jgi:cell division cycle 14